MKNSKFLILIAMFFFASVSNAQTTVVVDTLHNGDTIFYCSSIDFVPMVSHDTVSLNFLGYFPDLPANLNPVISNPGALTHYVWTPKTPLTDTNMLIAVLIGGYDWKYTNGADTSALSYQGGRGATVVAIKKMPTSKICWVTADSNFQHNVIIWDSTGFAAQNVDSVKIYYYITATQRKLLATRSRNSASFYVDSINNPQNGTFKYLLAGVNSCGNEDTNSAWQTTAWIQQSGSTFNVSSPYAIKGNPNPVSYYILYRDTIGNGRNWDSIFETPGTVLSDPNYAHYINAKYYVAAVLNTPCAAPPIVGHRPEINIVNKSRSNRLSNNITGVAPIAEANSFNVYPVPFTGTLNLHLQMESDVSIYNELGQMVFHSLMLSGQHQVNITGPSGVYFIDVNGVYKKLLKE